MTVVRLQGPERHYCATLSMKGGSLTTACIFLKNLSCLVIGAKHKTPTLGEAVRGLRINQDVCGSSGDGGYGSGVEDQKTRAIRGGRTVHGRQAVLIPVGMGQPMSAKPADGASERSDPSTERAANGCARTTISRDPSRDAVMKPGRPTALVSALAQSIVAFTDRLPDVARRGRRDFSGAVPSPRFPGSVSVAHHAFSLHKATNRPHPSSRPIQCEPYTRAPALLL
ncbi:hypothetical protein C8J57DRAFT_1235066 [Mycena rebaudengoi]|nr:hypothetical protein C8J57DRAFT_1235066 [Mycena rebaudengoi]